MENRLRVWETQSVAANEKSLTYLLKDCSHNVFYTLMQQTSRSPAQKEAETVTGDWLSTQVIFHHDCWFCVCCNIFLFSVSLGNFSTWHTFCSRIIFHGDNHSVHTCRCTVPLCESNTIRQHSRDMTFQPQQFIFCVASMSHVPFVGYNISS